MPASKTLACIIVAQFFCTSLWFAGNAVLPDLISQENFPANALANITSAVQFGFIIGTFVFALFSIADKYKPSNVFFVSAMAGAIINGFIAMDNLGYNMLLLIRFSTGFFLAGIYPVGMKIASDYFDKGLGKALGLLVGALVLGSALPFLLNSASFHLPWQQVVLATSLLSITGAFLVKLFVPAGPFRKPANSFRVNEIFQVFKNKDFSKAAGGYFGHMWELYSFWAFLPLILAAWETTTGVSINIPFLSFIIIASGTVGCIVGGYLSTFLGTKKVATIALVISGTCCLFSPAIFYIPSLEWLLIYLLVWGISVVADSPLFSTLAAQSAPAKLKGTALTIMNCIGFSITIISIQLLKYLSPYVDEQYLFTILAIGPIAGLLALHAKKNGTHLLQV